MKKVLVIDNLTETFEGTTVKSGLQKSSKLDARAFSAMGYDTTFLYCGEMKDSYPYKKISLNPLGAKDEVIRDNKHMRASGGYVKTNLEKARQLIEEADYIVGHCHSVSVMTGVNNMVKDKKILYVVHDIIDLMWAYGFSNAVGNMRDSGRNYSSLVTNSQYSVSRLNKIYERGKDKQSTHGHRLYSGNQAFDSYIKHFVWTDVEPSEEDIAYKEKKSAIIGRFEKAKFHHKLYNYKNPNNVIVHYGMKDHRRDEGLQYYNNVLKKANKVMEGLQDNELWKEVRSSQSVILPCHHEGFGYTAFEAGIFGVVPVIFTQELVPGWGHQHATVEYLTRAGATHFAADFNDNGAIFKAIDDSLKVTTEDRIALSHNLLKYFSLENYVEERIALMDAATKGPEIIKPTKTKTSLEKFFK